MYAELDESGQIKSLFKWPNPLAKRVATDEEVISFKSRRQNNPSENLSREEIVWLKDFIKRNQGNG